jgi:retron-type reverse transcriptase
MRASKKVKNIFTYSNFVKTCIKYRRICEIISDSSVEDRIVIPLYSDLLSDPIYLLFAFSSLKDKKVGGINDIPVANMTLAGLANLGHKIQSKRYKPGPVKRVFIPKANGKMRPLGIANTQDKVVQQAIKLVFDQVFEPTFSSKSHGFRPNKSCHTALHQIYWS